MSDAAGQRDSGNEDLNRNDNAVMQIVSSDTGVALETTQDGVVRLRLGSGSHGLTLIGELYELHAVIIEADRQLSQLTHGGARPGAGAGFNSHQSLEFKR